MNAVATILVKVKYRKCRRWRAFGSGPQVRIERRIGCRFGRGGRRQLQQSGGFGARPLRGGPVGAGGGIEIGDVDPGGHAGCAAQPAVGAGEREDRRHRRFGCARR